MKALQRTLEFAFIRFFTQVVRIKFTERADQVEQKLAFRRAQVERLLDSLEEDFQLLQLVDDLQRPFQPACQAIYLVDIEYLELAAPGSFAHGVDPGAELLAVG